MTTTLQNPTPLANDIDATIVAIASHGLPVPPLGLTVPLSDGAWTELLNRVAAQRIDGLLVSAIASATLPTTQEQRRSAVALHRRAMMRSLSLEQLLLDVVDALAGRGIASRVLKGPAIAHAVYPDPSLRSFCDVDVLVPAASFDEAVATMQSMGAQRRYDEPRPGFDRRFSKGASFLTPEGLAIDLHRTFVVGPFGLTVDIDGLFASSRVFTMAGRNVATLPLEETFVHVCLHTALGDWPPRLVPMRDVAQLALSGRLDEDRVHHIARSWRANAPMAWSIAHVWDAFGLPPHQLHEWARSYVPTRYEKQALSLYMSPERNYASMALASTRVVPGLFGKIAYLRALALPKRSYVGDRERSYRGRWRHALQVALRRARPRSRGIDRSR
jgi:hypothetical protein